MTQSTLVIEELDNCFVKTAVNIVQYYVDKEERDKLLEELRDIVKENCSESARTKAANDIKEQLKSESETNLDKTAVTAYEETIKKYKKAIADIQVDLSKEKRLIEYDNQIRGLMQVNNEVSDKSADDLDIDLQLTGTDINIIDPISKIRMTDPVRNAICGHIYDKESLTAMLQMNKKTRCPVVGCTSTDFISLSQCHTDIVTRLYLERNPA